jgi:hypothetical protein
LNVFGVFNMTDKRLRRASVLKNLLAKSRLIQTISLPSGVSSAGP